MDKITPVDIIMFKLAGEGTGTGYIWYRDLNTHNRCIDVYENGECVSRYQTNDDDMLKEILEMVKNDSN